jgi:hypothetical protein
MDCIPLPAAEQLPLDEAINALKPILAMATSPHLDSRVEAVKMICDLSSQMDLQSSLCAAGGIEILMELMTIDYGYCNQYAMCALANLSSSRSCQVQPTHISSPPVLSSSPPGGASQRWLPILSKLAWHDYRWILPNC